MTKISIAGATGYTGFELVRLLIQHPNAEIVSLTSETYAGQSISDVFPALSGYVRKDLVRLEPELPDCDFLFLALPHTTAMDWVPEFLKRGIRVIDLSADFRLKDIREFENWYQTQHTQPEILSQAVYGLPELYREKIRNAKLVANPGCYPTSAILGLAPLMKTNWIDPDSIIVDSKSGISGAGRKANIATQFAECNNALSAYKLGTHRHTPEIEQELVALCEKPVKVSFSPHLVPMNRGILSTMYVNLRREIETTELIDFYKKYYEKEPFVRILKMGEFANTAHVRYSNQCDISVYADPRIRRVVITSAIDNLVKGASGQAVQNFNLMLGIDETDGLGAPGLTP